MRILILIVSVFTLLGCQRKANFLHHVIPAPTPKTYQVTESISQIRVDSELDILWTIDNSGSMSQYQNEVIRNTELFIKKFSQLSYVDWKMGLISTDTSDDPYVGFTPATSLNNKVSKPTDVFISAVKRLGTSGSGTEKPFATNLAAIKNHPDFFRPKAVLALIMVTDAPEQSQMAASILLDAYAAHKGNVDKVVLYGVFGARDHGCISTGGEENWDFAGSVYEELMQKTNGSFYTLCKDDFGETLGSIGEDLVSRLESPKVWLQRRPIVSTIQVSHRGNLLPGGLLSSGGLWTYDFDLNAVVFHNLDFAPDDLEVVMVRYEEAETQKHQ